MTRSRNGMGLLRFFYPNGLRPNEAMGLAKAAGFGKPVRAGNRESQ